LRLGSKVQDSNL